LVREFSPVLEEEDLVNLPNFDIYLKLMIDGVTSQPFSAVTLLPPEPSASFRKAVIQASREKYARPRAEVERELLLREKLTSPVATRSRVQTLPL
jgi:hypothetical protein